MQYLDQILISDHAQFHHVLYNGGITPSVSKQGAC